ncbi:MAG: hypothetical protein AABW82_03635 [Nanoarchaeota archaeon]
MDNISYWKNPLDFFKKAGPGALFLIIALALMFIGALVPALSLLYKSGLVIFGFLFLVVVIWIVFSWFHL